MKNYSSITETYLASQGLVRVLVKDAATEETVLRTLTAKQLDELKRSGRWFTTQVK